MNVVSFDSETLVIEPRSCIYLDGKEFVAGTTSDRNPRAVLTSPFVPPRLVLGSFASSTQACVQPREAFLDILAGFLADPTQHLVAHNLVFDYLVSITARPSLRPAFLRAAAEGRLHDTLYLDLLYGLSIGRYDIRRPPDFGQVELLSRSLQRLAEDYTNIQLNKDEAVRCGFAQFDGVWPIPEAYREYALQDAVATLAVFKAITSRAPDTRFWGEATQVRAALALAEMDGRGLYIDCTEAHRLRALFEADMPALEATLVAAHLGLWQPKKGTIQDTRVETGGARDLSPTWHWTDGYIRRTKVFKGHSVVQTAVPEFHLVQRAVRARLEGLIPTLNEAPPRTEKTNELALDAEFWKDHIPPEDTALVAWERHEKLKKIIQTYLRVYSAAPRIYPKWNNLGARSTRMSAAKPSVQNVPKRRHGIRSLFVPPPGRVFVKGDYAAQEVYCLAEVMHGMGLDGPLSETLMTGQDIHRLNAGRMLQKAPADVTKDERQLAKVLVFGVGGGLGPKKLGEQARKDYGLLHIDTAAAKLARDDFLRTFPDIAEYLRRLNRNLSTVLLEQTGQGLNWWARELGVEGGTFLDIKRAFLRSSDPAVRLVLYNAEQIMAATLPTGFIRNKCTYTEAANTYFQGLAAHVTKEALFLCMEAGLVVDLCVHDELVVSCPAEEADLTKAKLTDCMLAGFKKVCPFIGPYAKVEVEGPLDRWGPATNKEGAKI